MMFIVPLLSVSLYYFENSENKNWGKNTSWTYWKAERAQKGMYWTFLPQALST